MSMRSPRLSPFLLILCGALSLGARMATGQTRPDYLWRFGYSPSGDTQLQLSISADRTRLATGPIIWDTRDGSVIAVMPGASRIKLSPDGRLYARTTEKALELYDIETAELVWSAPGSYGWIDISRDGKYLVCAEYLPYDYSRLSVFRASDGYNLYSTAPLAGRASAATFSPDGSKIIANYGSWSSGETRCYAFGGAEPTWTAKYPGGAWLGDFSPDGSKYALFSQGRSTLRVFSSDTGQRLVETPCPAESLCVRFSLDGSWLYVFPEGGWPYVRFETAGWTYQTDGKPRYAVLAELAPDPTRFYGHAGSSIIVGDLENGAPVGLIGSYKGEPKDLAYTADGRYVAVGSEVTGSDYHLRHVLDTPGLVLFDGLTGDLVSQIRLPTWSVAASSRSDLLVTAEGIGYRVFRVANGKLEHIRYISVGESTGLRVDISPDDNRFVAAAGAYGESNANRLTVIEIGSGQVLWRSPYIARCV